MNTSTKNTKTLVIGAGLAGLSAASELHRQGVDVALIDKGRGLGGRLAGRRIGDATFDHGAQFMTTRHPGFIEQVSRWVEAGVVQKWYSSIPGELHSHARYRGVPKMAAIAKHMAVGLDVSLSTRAVSISVVDNGWLTKLDSGCSIRSDSLLITAPVPQTLELLAHSNIRLSAANTERLARIRYESCIAVMAVLAQPSTIVSPGALALSQGPIAWISDNQKKGVSSLPAVTIHGSGEFSARYIDGDWGEAARQLIAAAKPFLGSEVVDYEVHGWRYSKPVTVDDWPYMLASESTNLPPLLFAGDAFAGPRVEGAVVSGWSAAAVIQQVFGSPDSGICS